MDQTFKIVGSSGDGLLMLVEEDEQPTQETPVFMVRSSTLESMGDNSRPIGVWLKFVPGDWLEPTGHDKDRRYVKIGKGFKELQVK